MLIYLNTNAKNQPLLLIVKGLRSNYPAQRMSLAGRSNYPSIIQTSNRMHNPTSRIYFLSPRWLGEISSDEELICIMIGHFRQHMFRELKLYTEGEGGRGRESENHPYV